MAATKETFGNDLLAHLFALNRIVSQFYGEPDKTFRCIGNLFYDHNTDYPVDAAPIAEQQDKRGFFATALGGRRSLLEIGFNAGHSALLALTAHPDLRYTGIDICETKYTVKCAEYLAKAFKGRFTFIRGDSREVLPHLATHRLDLYFDAFHIDGNHDEGPVRADIGNVLRIAEMNALVILDDTDMAGVAKAYGEYVELGRLRPATLKGFESVRRQSVARPVPDRIVSPPRKRDDESRGFLLSVPSAASLSAARQTLAGIRKHHADIPIVAYTAPDGMDAARAAVAQWTVDVRTQAGIGHGFFERIRSLHATPFDRTVYVESGTMIIAPLGEMFDALDHFEVLGPESGDEPAGESPLPKMIPSIDPGFIAYRLGNHKQAFFEAWANAQRAAPNASAAASLRLALVRSRTRYAAFRF